MAKIEFANIDKYSKQLAELGNHAEGICKFAVYEAAGIVIDAIKANTPVDTGALRDSAKLTDFKNKNGYIYTEVVFEGVDERGHPNLVKARVLESGSSKQSKRPFIRPAVNSVKAAAQASIEKNLDKKLKEYTKE